MKVAIHQPHYFPWLGYFDKIAKVERFVIMDDVQFVPRSYMSRNSFLDSNGELNYQTITVSKHGYREKTIKDIQVLECKKWQNKHAAFFRAHYSHLPFYKEIIEGITPVLEQEYTYLIDVLSDSIKCINAMLNIKTDYTYQSRLLITSEEVCEKQNEPTLEEKHRRQCSDVLAICKAAGGTKYLTGKGKSLEFIDEAFFRQHDVELFFQDYTSPSYKQHFATSFVPNISSLDLLFNCGVKQSRDIFWDNVFSTHEFESTGE